MFNDLNTNNTANHPAVDDIFAETDKPGATPVQNDIETHRVGLATTGNSLPAMSEEKQTANHNYTKIIIIVVAALLVLGCAYFAYSYFKTKSAADALNASSTPTKVIATTTNPVKTGDTGFVNNIPSTTQNNLDLGASSTSATINPVEIASSSSPSEVGLNTASTSVSITPETGAVIDTDSDGLSDAEEKKLGTDINAIDTDHDGLSDYEEVKIYHTNPLKADTDGDGYSDGAEVKSGYNPNGPGKLPGNVTTK